MKEITIKNSKVTAINSGIKDFKTWEQEYNERVGSSNQEFRQKFAALADRLQNAKTGYTMSLGDDKALLLVGYETNHEYGTVTIPCYNSFLYNVGGFDECQTLVDSLILEAKALELLHEELQKRSEAEAKAARLGLPGSLRFPLASGDNGPAMQTWIIAPDGTIRNCDYSVDLPNSEITYECWEQLLPGEVIATWGKPYIAAPHQFSLVWYHRQTEDRNAPWRKEALGVSSLNKPYSMYFSMTAMDDDGTEIAMTTHSSALTPAQVECLHYLQVDLESGYAGLADPIHGKPSPSINGGWLRLLGIESYEADEDE